MEKLNIPPFTSGGLILSYQCTNTCQHCIYASSPGWKDWIQEDQLANLLEQIHLCAPENRGIHIGGGEPFLNFELTLKTVELCIENRLPIQYVETNASWCTDDSVTAYQFRELRDSGLPAILISVSPFHNEFIPFERTDRAIEIAREIYGHYNVLIYTDYFFQQLKTFNPIKKNSLKNYIKKHGQQIAAESFIQHYGLIPGGRVASRLDYLFQKKPASAFINRACHAELSNPEHIHIDNYGNYIAGLCAGISLGNAFDLEQIFGGIDLSENEILKVLALSGPFGLFELAKAQFSYIELEGGYINKCHLCQDIRAKIVQKTDQYKELQPREFYQHL